MRIAHIDEGRHDCLIVSSYDVRKWVSVAALPQRARHAFDMPRPALVRGCPWFQHNIRQLYDNLERPPPQSHRLLHAVQPAGIARKAIRPQVVRRIVEELVAPLPGDQELTTDFGLALLLLRALSRNACGWDLRALAKCSPETSYP